MSKACGSQESSWLPQVLLSFYLLVHLFLHMIGNMQVMEVNGLRMIWNRINQLDMKKAAKNRIFLWIQILVNMVIGAVLWALVGRLFLPGIDNLICFMGYPAVFIGFFGGTLYLYNHEFA